jgi:hypothetical protein
MPADIFSYANKCTNGGNGVNKRKQSTRDIIGIDSVNDRSLSTLGDELVFFAIRPANLSTLSEESIRAKIYALMTVLKGVADIEMLCINSRENFDGNKRYLKTRIENEDNSAIRKLLEQDMTFLDRIQAQTATSREFFVIVRLTSEKEDEAYLSRVEKKSCRPRIYGETSRPRGFEKVTSCLL